MGFVFKIRLLGLRIQWLFVEVGSFVRMSDCTKVNWRVQGSELRHPEDLKNGKFCDKKYSER